MIDEVSDEEGEAMVNEILQEMTLEKFEHVRVWLPHISYRL